MTRAAQEESEVEVTFRDGTVNTYRITASVSISAYLAREAGETGILVLWNATTSTSIPVTQIAEWTIRPIPKPTTKEKSK